MKKNGATLSYCLVQAACWGTFAVLLNFSSNFLYDRGFTGSRISLLLGIATALSCGLQLGIAELTSRFPSVRLYAVLMAAGAVMLGCAAGMAFAGTVSVASFALSCVVLQTFPALCNSLGMDAIEKGSDTSYSTARCMGSLSYSVVAYTTGALISRGGTRMMPLLAALMAVFLTGSVFLYHLTGEKNLRFPENKRKNQKVQGSFLKNNPKFSMFLLGAVLLSLGHNLMSNFLLQIMTAKGGNAGHQGMAAGLSALVELPVMLFFPFLMHRVHCGKWVAFSAAVMVVKAVGVYLSSGPAGVIAIQATQMLGYGLFYIASVHYAVLVVDRGDAIRAQSYLASTSTIGTLIALSAGGTLCQYAGVQIMVLISALVSALGAAVVLLNTEKK